MLSVRDASGYVVLSKKLYDCRLCVIQAILTFVC